MASPMFQALSIALSVAGAGIFLLVARTVASRPVSQESRLARTAFVTWWGVLGGVTLAGLAMQMPGATSNITVYLVFLVTLLGLLCVGLWGLLYYLVYLFTSRRNLALPLALGYVVYFAFLTAVILGSGPMGFEETETGRQVVYERPIDESVLYWPTILLLILPPIAAAAGYLSLYWKVDQAVQKRRILLVSLSIIVWFGSSLVGSGLGLSGSPGWSVVSRLISLTAALTIYYAYRGLKPSEPEAQPSEAQPGEPAPFYQAPPRKGVSRAVRLLA